MRLRFVDVSTVEVRVNYRQIAKKLLLIALLLLAADFNGNATPIVPLLGFFGLLMLARRALSTELDSNAWKFATASSLLGLIGYAGIAAGFSLEHPVVLVPFVATYPLVIAAQLAFLRVRSINSQFTNHLDGAIMAVLCLVVMFRWVLPRQIEAGHSGMTLFVGLLFPTLGALSTGATVTLGSSVRWRFPPMLFRVVAAQIAFLLSDMLPLLEEMLGTNLGLGVRSSALAFILIIGATRASDRWVANDATTNVTPEFRIYLVVWGAAIASLAVLVDGNTPVLGRWFGALTILLAGVRLTLAYGQARHNSELRIEARTDELTGLQNRRALRELIDSLVASEQPFAVLILDLDNFKDTNDTLGHDAGDRMLRTVAARLTRVVKPHREQVQLFRLGGDEFAMVALEPSLAVTLAKESLSIIRVSTVIDNERIDQAVSIGVASFPTDTSTPADVLRLADAAMYRAKQMRTGYQFHDASQTDGFTHLRLLSVLRTALDAKAFELHYQPQVSLKDGSVIGLEALFRVPFDGGYLPTPEVIGAAESAGLLGELTDAVFERSMGQLRSLGDNYPGLVLSLNVSEQDFSSGTLADRVFAALRRNRLEPSQVRIEVTEESLLHDPEAARLTVNALRAQGMTVSMDDFGIGFSSLTNLRLLEVDELKIDRSFVTGMVNDSRTEALLVSIVEMARRLGSSVLIEGIEHHTEIERARAIGIDAAQGYVFAKPMPFDVLRGWLVDNWSRSLLPSSCVNGVIEHETTSQRASSV
jgi:diguanylate cyclase